MKRKESKPKAPEAPVTPQPNPTIPMELEEIKPKHPGGRPTKYLPEYVDVVYKLCLLGLKDVEIAKFFEVSDSTLALWKVEHQEFSDAQKRGKEDADKDVAVKLRDRALGYEHPEDKIFLGPGGVPVIVPTIKHYPPDPTAAIFWLKNRHPDKWRDKKELTGEEGGPLVVVFKGRDDKDTSGGEGTKTG